MRVERIQYPVGQGCFHAGLIQWAADESGAVADYRYIYDCGSTNLRALRGEVETYRAATSSVDALFVSHLDADHVNGLDHLLSAVSVNTVYIPYVDQETSILDLIEADLEGAVSASLIEAKIAPRSWFGSRGVSTVVRVLPRSDDMPPDDERNTGNDDGGGRLLLGSANTSPDRDAESTSRSGGRTQERDMRSGGSVPITDNVQGIRWLLVPHVDPAPAEGRKQFLKKIRTVLGLRPRQRINAAVLANALRDTIKRTKLKECYEEIISGGSHRNHNRTSMSLYSGPAPSERRSLHLSRAGPEHALWPHRIWDFRYEYARPCNDAAVGWIGTGDAPLQLHKVRQAWLNTYGRFRNHVSTILLPHHGSKRSFHPELLEFPNLDVCVVSAEYRSRYRHPGRTVVAQVRDHGKALYHVSERLQSAFREEIR